MELNKVIADLETAFGGVRCPPDDDIPAQIDSDSKSREKYFHTHEVRDFLRKNWRSWREIPGRIIERNYDSIFFFSAAAMPFFLPAFLAHALSNLTSLHSDIVSVLISHRRNFSRLTKTQEKVVLDVIKLCEICVKQNYSTEADRKSREQHLSEIATAIQNWSQPPQG